MYSVVWLLVLVAGVTAVASSHASQEAKSDFEPVLINDGQLSEADPKTALLEEDKQRLNTDLKTTSINKGKTSKVDLPRALINHGKPSQAVPKTALPNYEQPFSVDLKTALKHDGQSSLTDPKSAPPDDERPSSAKERLFFLGSYSTLTHIIVTYSTSTVPSFCLVSAATVACPAGRRRKRLLPSITKPLVNPSDGLDSSNAGISEDDSAMGNEESGRKFFTVWTKTLSTTTLTTTSLNTATLISLSYYCTAGSISLPGFCG